MLNSNVMNSNALVGFKNILPTNSPLSIDSGVSSNTTLKSVKPLLALMLSKIGLTRVKNWFLTTESFCSNNNLIETADISFLACNNKRLTLILLRAVSLTCKVLLPQILTPSDAKVVIGLILPSYKTSLSS